MWAELERQPAAHCRPHAVCLRLVTRGKHDSGADDDGAATQRGVVPLLHGGVEGVDVRVEDGRLLVNEHMFVMIRR